MSKIVGKKKYAIGIDLGGQSIKGALVDTKGKIVIEHVYPTESHKGAKHVINQMRKLTHELAIQCKVRKGVILGACVATPGLIDMKTWILKVAPNIPGFVNIPLRKEVQKGPRYKAAKRAVRIVKEFLMKHMKSEEIR